MTIHRSALAAIISLGTMLSTAWAESTTPNAPTPTAEDQAKKEAAMLKKLGAQRGGVGQIGSRAEMEVPPGYTFFPAKGAQQLLKGWGNLVNGNEDGLIMHDEKGWSVCFEFDDVGYVKDDEKDNLDADKMLKQMHDSEPDLNEARKEAGLPAQHTVGFEMPPVYNEQTHNLEWAINFTVKGHPGQFVNYHTKLLGRKGVMTATLMCDPGELKSVLPEYQKTLTGFHFTGGETYAEYRKGDKIATYGLGGLVVGGAVFAAAKAGLFSKLWVLILKGGKAVILGVVALFAAIGKFFKRLFGRRESPYQQ